MLPGFRFLIAAVVLSISLLIFGLGAASLLRSAREEFASLPVRRAAPQSMFPQQQPEAPPTLAMLRLEPHDTAPAPVAEAPAPLPVATTTSPAEAPQPPTDKVASLDIAAPDTAPPAEEPEPEVTKIDGPAAVTAALAPAEAPPGEAPASAPEVTSAIESVNPDLPTTTLTEADTRLASTRIATLGGPAVDTEPVPLPMAKPKPEPVKKAKARPAKKRRVAERVTSAAAAPAQTDPFGQPFPR
jgi:hypothetical protein